MSVAVSVFTIWFTDAMLYNSTRNNEHTLPSLAPRTSKTYRCTTLATEPLQASEALAELLCHPSGADGSNSYDAPSGRLQSGVGYLGSGGGGGGAVAAAAAAREAELHWKQLMFFLDM